MSNVTAKSYVETMLPWLKKMPEFLRTSPTDSSLRYYGTGESAHWPTQSNCNVFAALAVLSEAPELPETERAGLRDTALSLLRYAMATHVSGKQPASDGKQWGCHWISVLGLERMGHGINAIRKHLTEEDNKHLRKLMLTEADWLLDVYPVVADIVNSTGNNKPESNIWNGGQLLRVAFDYPDAPRAAEYREKATKFLLNGISFPADAFDETCYNGKPAKEYHVGPNFTENWSLDHHGYLNVGYMVICLSNLAMLHFHCKERGHELPPELYRHAKELWNLIKACTFRDGRLLRIGGDTRARYTYCQNYAIPMWLFAADYFGDADAAEFERGWIEIMKQEAAFCGDGGFYGRRLAKLSEISYYYYARLESDAILCLSYGAYWRRKFQIPGASPEFKVNPPFAWQDEFHGATLLRDGETVRSFVWHSAQGPSALCLPAGRSDMAEWQNNLRGEIRSGNTPLSTQGQSSHIQFPGGFLNCGVSMWQETNPMGENEDIYTYAEHQTACVALPDEKTMLFLEYAEVIKEATIVEIKGLSLKMPNDLFNRETRSYRTADGTVLELTGNPGRSDDRILPTDRLSIDNTLNVFNLYGSNTLTIRRTPERSIIIHRKNGPWMPSLYVDEICNEYRSGCERLLPGTVALDNGYAVAAGGTLSTPTFHRIPQSGKLRVVEFHNKSGAWIFAANFGSEEAATPDLPNGASLIAGSLCPGKAALWKVN